MRLIIANQNAARHLFLQDALNCAQQKPTTTTTKKNQHELGGGVVRFPQDTSRGRCFHTHRFWGVWTASTSKTEQFNWKLYTIVIFHCCSTIFQKCCWILDDSAEAQNVVLQLNAGVLSPQTDVSAVCLHTCTHLECNEAQDRHSLVCVCVFIF